MRPRASASHASRYCAQRSGLEQRDYPQVDYLAQALDAARAVTAQAFVEQGLQGPKLGAAIQAARIDAIESVKAKYPQPAKAGR